MKKLLLASTAIVGFAGAAAAEVAVSGSAEMGIVGGTGVDTQFHQSVDVRFSMSGETDGGLSFGATVDLEDALDANAGGSDLVDDTGFADYTVFISGDFGTLTMGDTDGAMDWALQEANIGDPGTIQDDETGHAGYLGSYLDGDYDGQVLRYNYSFGDIAFAVSLEDDAAGGVGPRDMGYALGFRYGVDLGAGSLAIGVGYQSVDYTGAAGGDGSATGISLAYSSDMGFSGVIVYTEYDNAIVAGAQQDASHLAIGVGYTTGAITLHANYGQIDATTTADRDGFGLAAAYDLGGGASVHFGYGTSSITGLPSTDSFSLGLAMSF